jgi:peptidoglycan hydrolase CwlO-like protein
MGAMSKKKEQYDKDFKYVPPEKQDKTKEELKEQYNKLRDSVHRLDGNMKAMHTDNRTLRKHVTEQQRLMKSMNDRITSHHREIMRLNRIIDMILKNDEDDFKGKNR